MRKKKIVSLLSERERELTDERRENTEREKQPVDLH